MFFLSYQNCEDIRVELVGGANDKEGRIEVVRNGVRGTVCDDDWDQFDAAVVCRMLEIEYVQTLAQF